MPIHDWSRVFDGAFHAFHHAWIAELEKALNRGILPPDYYATTEHVDGPVKLRALTLRNGNGMENEWRGQPIEGAIAVATTPPRVWIRDVIEVEPYTRRQRSVVICHASDDRRIALIDVLSEGNKSSNREFHSFVAKAVDSLGWNHHLLLIDLLPRTARDPEGIHTVIWAELGGKPKPAPADKPLTLVAYDAGPPKTYYEEPVAVGDVLIDMPLFLAPGWYVSVPLEATYQAAWRGVPRRYRDVLERRD